MHVYSLTAGLHTHTHAHISLLCVIQYNRTLSWQLHKTYCFAQFYSSFAVFHYSLFIHFLLASAWILRASFLFSFYSRISFLLEYVHDKFYFFKYSRKKISSIFFLIEFDWIKFLLVLFFENLCGIKNKNCDFL